MLSLVLPKGSLEKATLDLFDAADLTVRRASDRDYHASIDDPRIDRVRFLRPQEIPSYLERGLFDIGITGRDWITETQADVISLGELQYSKQTSNPVRVVLAVPDGSPWQSVADLPEGIRISTEFPSLTERFLAAHGVKAMIVPSYGATEAKVPGHRRRHRRPDRDRLVAAQERAAHPGDAADQLHRARRVRHRLRRPGQAGRHGGHRAAAARRHPGPRPGAAQAQRGGRQARGGDRDAARDVLADGDRARQHAA